MNYSYVLWRMIFVTTILIHANNTVYAMEKEPTEYGKLLKAIEEDLPEDVQTIIYKTFALLKMSDFLLEPIIVNKTESLLKIASKKINSTRCSICQNNDVWCYGYCTDTENYSNQLLKSLSGYTQDYGAPAQLYEDKIVMCSKNGSIKIWGIPEGQLLDTLIMDTQAIESVLLIDHKVITIYSDKTAKIWPQYTNLDTPEFNKNGESFIWNNITIPQADLIARMYEAKQTNEEFIINIRSEDLEVFLSFDENIRLYLEERLSIGFAEPLHPYNRKPYSRLICAMQ